jgi:hypothetical protein
MNSLATELRIRCCSEAQLYIVSFGDRALWPKDHTEPASHVQHQDRLTDFQTAAIRLLTRNVICNLSISSARLCNTPAAHWNKGYLLIPWSTSPPKPSILSISFRLSSSCARMKSTVFLRTTLSLRPCPSNPGTSSVRRSNPSRIACRRFCSKRLISPCAESRRKNWVDTNLMRCDLPSSRVRRVVVSLRRVQRSLG